MCGRAIYCEKGSSLSIENIGFWRYGAAGYDGYVENYLGAIYADNAKLKLSNVEFGWCISEENGGAIYANNCNIITVNTEFNYCESYGLSNKGYSGGGAYYHGGAIYAESGSKIIISDNVIDSYCTTQGNGGAIYLRIPNIVIVNNNKIINNSCGNKGGGITIVMDEGSNVTLEENIISSNEADNRGGGLSIINVGGNLHFISGEISNNKANWGGGIDYTTKYLMPLNLYNVLITENSAPRGGVWACPTSETEIYSTLGGAIYGNNSEGEIDDWQNNSIYVAAGDDIRYEGYSDTDDRFAKRNYDSSKDSTSFMTVSQRVLGGGLMKWYRDEPNGRFKFGDTVADAAIYTNTNKSFGLHGELTDEFEKIANSAALIKIVNNTAETRGGGIASNSPIIIGEKDADVTVNVEKQWVEESHPDKVVVDLYRVDAQGSKVKLDSNIILNAENNWKATFRDLPSAYIDQNGDRKSYFYEFGEQNMQMYDCVASNEVSEDGKTYTIILKNTLKPSELIVSKTVSDDGADTNKAFTFTVTLDDKTINGTYGEMTFENGIAKFTLKANESKTAPKASCGSKLYCRRK